MAKIITFTITWQSTFVKKVCWIIGLDDGKSIIVPHMARRDTLAGIQQWIKDKVPDIGVLPYRGVINCPQDSIVVENDIDWLTAILTYS
jgi:hypothetical protein